MIDSDPDQIFEVSAAPHADTFVHGRSELSPDGTIGTKDFFNKDGENGASTGHSTYDFPDGSIVANYSLTSTGTQAGGHMVGKYQIISGTGAYQGATGGGSIEGDWGDKSPLKNAALFNIELDVKTPRT